MLHGFRTKVVSVCHSLRTKHSELAGEVIFRSSSPSFSHLLSHQPLKHSPSKSSLLCCSFPTSRHKVFSSGAHIHTVFPLKYPLIVCMQGYYKLFHSKLYICDTQLLAPPFQERYLLDGQPGFQGLCCLDLTLLFNLSSHTPSICTLCSSHTLFHKVK